MIEIIDFNKNKYSSFAQIYNGIIPPAYENNFTSKIHTSKISHVFAADIVTWLPPETF